ncbi:MAG TPA: adenylate/guanylate cyclase domain-containing protein [Mycobacteriales bacterium]|nr:adenylate/guanylate cyclase domain-containing protein [Mycobacteriales bacterium]
MDPPPTEYVERDGAALAYQVVGNGPVNSVVHLEIIHHLDLLWTDPHSHRNMERLADNGRAVLFQRRGFGLSEPVPYIPTLEQQADDVLAVMDAVGMDRAWLFGMWSSSGAVALAAACAPERVNGLLMYLPYAEGLPAGPELPTGWTEDAAAGYRAVYHAMLDRWGAGMLAPVWSEVADTPFNRRLMGMLERSGATPAVARAHFEWGSSLDLTDVLRAITVPTHVIRQASDRFPEAAVRRVAELVPGATYQDLPAIRPGSSLGEGLAPIVDYFEGLVTGETRTHGATRALGTVLFTDIVGSTELLARLGDTGYREIRDAHERQVRLAVEDAGGRLVKVLGDGTMSLFDGPSRAVRAADVIRNQAPDLDIEVRAGLHTGEIVREGTDIAGMTVHIGARVSAAARPGEVLVSRTVRDILVGSGLEFVDRGEHELKGVPGGWELYALEGVRDAEAVALEPSMQTVVDRAAVVAARRAPGAMRAMARMGNAVQRRRARAS